MCFGCLAFLPSMIERKQGTIVFISSLVGRVPIPYRSAYTASKHALQAFADCLRAEIDQHNIHVMVSSPGYVATDISQNALTGYGALHGSKFGICLTHTHGSLIFICLLVTDPETAKGETPQSYAYHTTRAILREDKEVIPFKFKPVILLRSVFPSLYFLAMKFRAQKLATTHHAHNVV